MRVDFRQLIKVYRGPPEGDRRYSPAEVVSTEVVPIAGSPDPQRICTSPRDGSRDCRSGVGTKGTPRVNPDSKGSPNRGRILVYTSVPTWELTLRHAGCFL